MGLEYMDEKKGSSPSEGDELLRELDQELDKIKPESPVSEDDKTPSELPPKEKLMVPKERLDEVLKENKRLKQRTVGEANPMEVVKLAKALEGHSEDEIDFITRNAKGSKVEDIIAASKDEWVRDAISARRQKEKNSKKTPSHSGDDFSTSGRKDWREIQKMKPEEFRQYEEEQLRGGGGV